MKKTLLNLFEVRFVTLVSFLLFNVLIYAQEITILGNNQPISDEATGTSLNDFTNFDGNTTRTFTIDNSQNSGNTTLTVNSIILSNDTDFSITSNPAPIGITKNGANPTFTITFNALSAGTFSSTVIIDSDATNDGGDNLFTFTVSADNTPEIEIEDSNNIIIANGGSFDFGTITPGAIATENFSINNTADVSSILTLEGINPDYVTISGDSEFSITTQPSSNTISGQASESFTISYNPLAVGGPHNATISIDNDDPDDNEDPYIFTVQGLSDNIVYTPTTDGPDWTVTNITPDETLAYPYEITYGPDGFLWITERRPRNAMPGKSVVRVDPSNGTKTTMIDLSSVVYQSAGQDGLMGMAIHPDLYTDITTTTNNYVFVAYTYSTNGSDSGRQLRIARLLYDNSNSTLSPDTSLDANGTIIEGLPASNDHNSGRLAIGPDLKLYYTIGDQGANQFANACNEIRAQYLPTSIGDYSDYKGKILRLELDGSIPSTNPTLGGFQTHIYTYGHRNAQGIIFGSDGKLYSSEHGAKVDDELNLITAGKNYGWPLIAGYYDNLSYQYCNWSSSGTCDPNNFSDHNCASGVTPTPEFTSGQPADFQEPIGTYNSTTGTDPLGGWLTWPTVAPSSIDIYEAGLIPNWNKSLLITTLKRGTLFRAKLNASADALESQVYEEFHSSNDRYRDIAMDPDGITMYIVTDNSGGTSGPSGTSGVTIENPGVVIKIQYTGSTSSNWYADTDNDNYGDINDLVTAASQPSGYVSNSDDCDDNDANEFPGQTWYLDADADGYSEGSSTVACSRPANYYTASELTATSGDCDDSNAIINSPITYYVDADGDGFGSTATADLCETSAPAGYSTNNTDCNDTNAAINSPITYYVDADGDGFGSTSTADLCATSAPAGYSDNDTDCDDANAAINSPITYYIDADGDGFGSTTTANLCATSAPPGYSDNNTDCDDANAAINSPITYYIDADGDGFGSTSTADLCATSAPAGYSDNNTDCDDANAAINSPITYYIDADGDGFGSTATADLCATSAPAGYSDNNTDCDDANAAI
ncbi:PQQ-dependent sugar dehydrogenase, partial [Flavisericum labens]|uniref:PQQ-dependent sugar dehydrogenase n=1 Tax=Flavisericum labens TaxID=3377112 RepID=UPI00387A9C9E